MIKSFNDLCSKYKSFSTNKVKSKHCLFNVNKSKHNDTYIVSWKTTNDCVKYSKIHSKTFNKNEYIEAFNYINYIIKKNRKHRRNERYKRSCLKQINNNKQIQNKLIQLTNKKSTGSIKLDTLWDKWYKYIKTKPIKQKIYLNKNIGFKDWAKWEKHMEITGNLEKLIFQRQSAVKKLKNKAKRTELEDLLDIKWKIITLELDKTSNYDTIIVKPWWVKSSNDESNNYDLILNEWKKRCGKLGKYWTYVGGSGGDDDQWSGPPGTSKLAIKYLKEALDKYNKKDWPIASSYGEFIII